MRLRLVHQLDSLARGEIAGQLHLPSRLSRADAVLVREAMRTVAGVQAEIRERFATDFVPS